MADCNYFEGEIRIAPPLTAPEIRRCPELQDLQLRIDEQIEPTDDGETVRRTADAVFPDCQGMSGRLIKDELAALLQHFGAEHAFTGHIDVRYENGYGGPGIYRIRIRDGAVEEVEPTLVWPGDTAEGEPDPAMRITQVWYIEGAGGDYTERFATLELAQQAAEVQWRNENEPAAQTHSTFEWFASGDQPDVFEAYISVDGLGRVATEWSVVAQPVIWSRPDEDA
jgi:Family of unknown function (DUF6205)